MQTPSHRIEYLAEERALLVEFGEELRVVSSLPYQPPRTSVFVFKQVKRGFREPLEKYYEAVREKIGIPNAFIFLTAAETNKPFYSKGEGYVVVATLGLEPVVCPSYQPQYEPLTGTINLLVVAGQGLAESGLMDLYRVAVEAKTLAMVELLLRCKYRSPGTVTDAVAVAAPPGEALNAGMATVLGSQVSKAIYQGLVDHGVRILGLEGLVKNWVGYSLDEVIELAMQAYQVAPIPGLREEEARRELSSILHRLLLDPNIQALLVMAREADLHASSGSIPGIGRSEYEADSKAIIGDELLGTCLAIYAAGFKALLAAYWVERLKEKGVVSINLPVFEDDVVSALIGSILTKLYNKHLYGEE